MLKKEIIKKLKELKIGFNPALKKDELFELLPKEINKENPTTSVQGVEKIKVALYNKWGQHVCDYALNSHGKTFLEIAEAEAKRIEGYVK